MKLAIVMVITMDLPIVKYHTLEKSENLLRIGMKLKTEFSKLALTSKRRIPVLINCAMKTYCIILLMSSLL